MNITESNKKELNKSNVFEACNGDYHESRRINRRYILQNDNSHKLIHKRKGLELVIDKDANDLDKVFWAKGRTIPPDEILDMMKPGKLKIPFTDPKDSSGAKLLPSSELLKSIHYFVSKKYTRDLNTRSEILKYVEFMDETALLGMGMMLESWVDELVTEDTSRMFLQKLEDSPDSESSKPEVEVVISEESFSESEPESEQKE
ncbi:UAF complex subunit Rrn10 family protein [Candida parapsilosis]|uniref:Uncharacterized protein n=2 Tax=Candida parapsilosis TaxID=5480 RepID=G8BG92_CANPC|nr:uncharacterized protein CPAR2_205190 [Candida parapsilosis]KAF6054975.1 UAF complex subunit Rrn10 family protein [Candida parapsilosis]KAF6056002.1 UAF complex subunit Rrn10 family protein [Candida parapsilosis]KAF6058932.1 UAF complex subunit Rrn10 family protein [Candida parapsilosis]KAF6067689.1 UAF complex subunit Rrn10 family protein [Candida parapsilosis]KAI5901917.1 hypothetical protein K4G60_g1056 [Candida parapsilosis]